MRFFFNNTLRSYDIAVGTLLNDLWIIHYDFNNKKDIQEYKVPLKYYPKLHWYLRKYDNIPNDFNVKTVLPCISYSRLAPQYDSKRQLNKYTRIKGNKQYSPEIENYVQKWAGTAVPYNIPYEVNLWTHTLLEMNQLMEQILSFFQVQTKTLFIRECPLFDIGRSCRLIIDSTSSNYSSEFDVKGDRVLRQKINLTLEGCIYSVIKENYVIKEIDTLYIENEEQQNKILAAINNGEQITEDMILAEQKIDEGSLSEDEIPDIDEGYKGEVCHD